VKETQREQQLLVFVLLVTAAELLFCDQLVQALHVGLQTLWRHVTANVSHHSAEQGQRKRGTGAA